MKQPVAGCENYNQCYGTQQKQLKQRKESSNLDSPFPKQAIIEQQTDCQPHRFEVCDVKANPPW